MAQCESLPVCIFFNNKMAAMPVTAERMKKRYCLTDNSDCARYMVLKALGKEKVPIDLFPHNIDRARQLIATE